MANIKIIETLSDGTQKELCISDFIGSTEFQKSIKYAIEYGKGVDYIYNGEDEVPYDTFDSEKSLQEVIRVLISIFYNIPPQLQQVKKLNINEMATLRGLEGTTITDMECEFFYKPSEIKKILDSGKAATTAGDNGAINIWKDDEGFIRCETMRYMRTIDKQRFAKISDVKAWAKKWLLEIE